VQLVEITHPFHPLFGRRFELVSVRQTWGEYRVYFHDDKGQLRLLPASWTDADAVDPFIEQAAARAHFKAADLLALVCLVRDLSAGGHER